MFARSRKILCIGTLVARPLASIPGSTAAAPAGREATMRQILAEGQEIGDHTMDQVEYPGYARIAGAGERIAAYTHFYRPYG